MASIEKVKIENLIKDGKIKTDENSLQPIKFNKISNVRTIYEGERNMLNKSFFGKIFGCI